MGKIQLRCVFRPRSSLHRSLYAFECPQVSNPDSSHIPMHLLFEVDKSHGCATSSVPFRSLFRLRQQKILDNNRFMNDLLHYNSTCYRPLTRLRLFHRNCPFSPLEYNILVMAIFFTCAASSCRFK